MTRAEALALAVETVDKLSSPPINARGYTQDRYTPPTVGERVAAVLKLAEFLTTDTAEETE